MIIIDEIPAVRLTSWAWLHVGHARRLIGWDTQRMRWVTTGPLCDVGSSTADRPPRWAVTVNGQRVILGEPGPASGDGLLEAIDRLRNNRRSGIEPGTPLRIVPWRPAAAESERRAAG